MRRNILPYSPKPKEFAKKLTLIIVSLSLIALSCNNSTQSTATIVNQDSVITSMTKARDSGEKIEGRFLKIHKLTERTYALSLQVNKNSIEVFETYMPLDSFEISLLKKEGNNISLTYKVFLNPETKKSVKMVQYMQPIYESQRQVQ